MDRSTVTPHHPVDPRLASKKSSSQGEIPTSSSTQMASSLKDPRGPRPDPTMGGLEEAHGNGTGGGPGGEQQLGDKAKHEPGDPRDHKPSSAYQETASDQRNLTKTQVAMPTSGGGSTGGNSGGGSKIFVGGLSWETDEGSLRRYFETFGEVLDCVIMRDRHTGHPRGFGFVTFSDDSVAERAASRRHDLDGRQVEAKRAVPRNEFPPSGGGGGGGGGSGGGGHQSAMNPNYGVRSASYMRGGGAGGGSGSGTVAHHTTRGKVFVGGLPSSCGNEEFKAYFQQYGEVVDAQVMIDHNTGNSRGFGFVTFANENVVETVVGPGRSNTRHEIMGKTVEVKRAEPKGVSTTNRHRGGGAGGGGGGSSLGGAGSSGGAADASAAATAAAYYGNYASASLAEQYGAYYNNPQWQQYYAAMGYNFSAYPQGYNPYTYLQAYMSNVANGSAAMPTNDGSGAGAPTQTGASDTQGYDVTRAARYGAPQDATAGSNGSLTTGAGGPGAGSAAASRRTSRRDERYHPYR